MKGVPKECKSRTTGCVFGTLGHCGQTKNPSNHQTNHGQGTPKCGCYVASLPMLRERPGCGGQRLALLWSKMSRPNMQHHFLGCAILPGSINPYPTAWAYELRMLFRNSLDLAHAQLNLPTHAVTICHKSVVSLPAHRNLLTAAGLTLNHNKRADWNLCHVSCTIKVAMAPHAGGPWEAI